MYNGPQVKKYLVWLFWNVPARQCDDGFALKADMMGQSKHQPDFLHHCWKANLVNPLSNYNSSCFVEENIVSYLSMPQLQRSGLWVV